MFLAASQLDLESELSAMLRLAGLQYGTKIPNAPNLFLNTHPAELVTCGLLKSLRHIREIYPEQPITLEVHEAAATDATMMKKLREELNALRMQLAYDDFGAGQSRLVELMAVSPDVVKFDMTLIRDINLAPPRQQQMLANLVRMVREMGIKALAEGVETEAEHVGLPGPGLRARARLLLRPPGLRRRAPHGNPTPITCWCRPHPRLRRGRRAVPVAADCDIAPPPTVRASRRFPAVRCAVPVGGRWAQAGRRRASASNGRVAKRSPPASMNRARRCRPAAESARPFFAGSR